MILIKGKHMLVASRKIFSTLLISLSFASPEIFAANSIEGVYKGKVRHLWRILDWGKECTLTVDYKSYKNHHDEVNSSYLFTINYDYDTEFNEFSTRIEIPESEFYDLIQSKNTGLVLWSIGSRFNGDGSCERGKVYLKEGSLDRVDTESAYLISPTRHYTCGELVKVEEDA